MLTGIFYLAAKSEGNTTSVFAYKRIFRGLKPAAG